MTINLVETDAGSGGAKLPTSNWTQGSDTVRLPLSGLMFSVIDTTGVMVSATDPLPVVQTGALPAGTNVIGHVIVDTAPTTAVTQSGSWTVAVTGVATAANQATEIASLASIDGKITACNTGAVVISSALPAGTNVIGHVICDTGSTTAVTGNVTVVNSGTFATQAAQSGTWNITNISGTVSLPTGAATAAKQPALGTAGTPSTDVLTVQGRSGMTALVVDGSGVTQPVSGTVSVNTHAVTQSGTWTVQPGNTANTTAWLVTGTGGSFPVTDSGGSLTIDNSTLAVVGGGTEAAAMRVTIATDSTGVVSIDDNGGSLTVDGTITANIGTVGTLATAAKQDTGNTSLSTIAGAVSGTEMQVDVLTMPTTAVSQSGSWSVTADTELPAAGALGDDIGNPTTVTVGAFLSGWNAADSVWDRVQCSPVNADGEASHSQGVVDVMSHNYMYNGTTWDRFRGDISNGLDVDVTRVGGTVAVTQSGTWNIGTVTAVTTVGAVTAITNALPAGTNAIGKLAANSGVDIGDVDITSIIPGVGATNLGKAVDTATGSTDTGVLALATRDDALSSLTPAEGDNVQLRTDANGALWVIPSGTITVASHAVTNAGTFAVQAAQSGTWTVTGAGGTFPVTGTFWQATQPTSIADGSDVTLGTKTDAKSTATDTTSVSVVSILKQISASVQAPPSQAVTNAGTFAVQSTLQTGNNVAGQFKITDGTDIADVLDLTSSNPLAVAIVDGSGDQITSFGGGTQYTEDAAAAANPVGTAMIGVRADSLAGLTTTDGDNVAARMTDKGEQYVKHVDAIPITDNSGSITVDNGGTFAVQAVCTNAGTFATQSVCTNAGTFAVQATLAAGAASIGKAEDAASADADVGVPAMAVRKATPANTSGTDGDYEMLQMSVGRLWVSATVDAALPAGTNAIGKLASNTGVTIGAVEIAAAQTLATVTTVSTVTAVTAITNALPAGTNLLGRVASSDETSTIYNATTALTPKFAKIAASSSGDNTLVAAVTSKKIRVLAYNFIGNGAVNGKFQSGAAGTDLTGLKYIAAAGGGICANYNPLGWFETASGVLLNLNLSGAVAVGGELVYVEV